MLPCSANAYWIDEFNAPLHTWSAPRPHDQPRIPRQLGLAA